MNLTISNHSNIKNTSGYEHYNDLEFGDLENIVKSGFHYVACKLKNEVRNDNNFDGFVDVLILDIDENCTIVQAKKIFSKFEFFLITTKSHQKLKNDIICDRFRLFIPLEKTVFIKEQMEQIYNDILLIYPFLDNKCRNVSRLFYSSPVDAYTYYNGGLRYPVRTLSFYKTYFEVPKVEKNPVKYRDEVFVFDFIKECWINKFGEVLEDEKKEITDIEYFLKGALTILDNEFYKGNRNHCIFKVCSMLLADGLNDDVILDFVIKENDTRGKIPFNELMACFKSAKKYN